MSHAKLDSWQTGNQGILPLRGTEDVISACRQPPRQQRDIGTGIGWLCGCFHDQHPRSSRIRRGRFGYGQELRGHDVQQFRWWGPPQVNQQLKCIFILLLGATAPWRSANSRALAWPMPEAPPVTIITLLVKSI